MPASSTQIPLTISIAPFPEGFKGNMDETFQQAVQLMEAWIAGNFLTGLILPTGSTLPTSDQGPIAMGGQWYFWDSALGRYVPQTVPLKPTRNYAKNSIYQIQQTGPSIAGIGIGVTSLYDMCQCRTTQGGVVAVSADVGPVAGPDNDGIVSSIAYTVGPNLVPTLAATDIFAHEHLFEGADVGPLQGQVLALSFSVLVTVPGTYSVYLTSTGRDASYVVNFTISTPNQWTRIKVTGIPPFPTSFGTWSFAEGATGLYVGVVMGTGQQWVTAQLNVWEAGFFAGSSANTNLLNVANNQIKITGMKLEAGPNTSYFVVNGFDTDFTDAARYYFTSFNYQTQATGVPFRGQCPANGQWLFGDLFPRRMGKVPVITPYGYNSKAAGLVTNMSDGNEIAAPTLAGNRKGLNDLRTLTPISASGNIASQTGIVGTLTVGSCAVTASNTANLVKGQPVSAAGGQIPAGAVVDSILSTTSFNLSAPATIAGTGVALTFGTANVTALANTTGMAVGQPISGTGIKAGTTIAAIPSGTTLTLSQPASPGTGVALTIQPVADGDVVAAFIVADARLT